MSKTSTPAMTRWVKPAADANPGAGVVRDVVGRFLADRQGEMAKHAGTAASQRQLLRGGTTKPVSHVRGRGR